MRQLQQLRGGHQFENNLGREHRRALARSMARDDCANRQNIYSPIFLNQIMHCVVSAITCCVALVVRTTKKATQFYPESKFCRKTLVDKMPITNYK